MKGQTQRPVCIFCFEPQLEDGLQNLLVHRGQAVYAILNRYPYTSGHLMIVPFAHLESIENLTTAAQVEMVQLISHSVRVLRKVYKPDGFNIGANIGAAAGAGIAGHLHIHIVPRWGGDTNFMSSLGDTRVLPETLEDTFQRLKDAWQEGLIPAHHRHRTQARRQPAQQARQPHQAPEVRSCLIFRDSYKAKFSVKGLQLGSAGEVERRLVARQQMLDDGARYSLPLEARPDGDGCQFADAAVVGLDLPAAEHPTLLVHRKNKPPPVQPGWVDPHLPDQLADGAGIRAAGGAEAIRVAVLPGWCAARLGSALPRIFFITWPTNQPIRVTLPAL